MGIISGLELKVWGFKVRALQITALRIQVFQVWGGGGGGGSKV